MSARYLPPQQWPRRPNPLKLLRTLYTAAWLYLLRTVLVPVFVSDVRAQAVFTDDQARLQNRDTIYNGSIILSINSTKAIPCLSNHSSYGPSTAWLRIGPNHNPGYDRSAGYDDNPFFLWLAGGVDDKFLGSLQSSITSKGHNRTWWNLQGWKASAGKYGLSGTMIRGVDLSESEAVAMVNSVRVIWEVSGGKKEGECKEGTRRLLKWQHFKDSTTITGTVDTKIAKVVLHGALILPLGADETLSPEKGKRATGDMILGSPPRPLPLPSRGRTTGKKREVQELVYTLTFDGQYFKGSAPLPEGGLVWKERGKGPSKDPYVYPRVDGTTSTKTSTTRRNSKTSKSRTKTSSSFTKTSSSITSATETRTTSTTRTKSTTSAAPDNDNSMPRSSITGIIVGGVLAIVLFATIMFLVKKKREEDKKPKVYPEIAYIYSTPYTSGRTDGVGGGGASSGAVTGSGEGGLGSRSLLVAGPGAGMAYGKLPQEEEEEDDEEDVGEADLGERRYMSGALGGSRPGIVYG